MNFGSGMLVVGGVIGLALALFGVRMLVTGRVPGPAARAFRTPRDAGFYHLLFGVALVLLAAGTRVKAVTAVSAVLAVALVAIAVIRFRPRGGRSGEGEEE